MGQVSNKLIELAQEMMGFIVTKKDNDDLFDEVQEWLLNQEKDLRGSASMYAKQFVKENRQYKLASIKIIATEILAQASKAIFSYGASSPDGDYRYFDRIAAYIDGNRIDVYHTGGGAAGGMDTFGGGVSNQKVIETFTKPFHAGDIINWIKRTIRRNSGYPFLELVKLKNITWYRADKSQVKGLSNQIVQDVLDSYEPDYRSKLVPKQKRIDKVIIDAEAIWKRLDKDVKERLIEVDSMHTDTYRIDKDDLIESIVKAFNSFDTEDAADATAIWNLKSFAKTVKMYGENNFTQRPLKGNEQYIKTGNDPWDRKTSKIAKEILAGIPDKTWDDFLEAVITTHLQPQDFKYLEYAKAPNYIVIRDIDGNLGHFAERVSDKKIAEWTIPNRLKGKTTKDLIKYLKNMGAKEGTR